MPVQRLWRRHTRETTPENTMFRRFSFRTGVTIMGGKTDVVKGRVKEAAGH